MTNEQFHIQMAVQISGVIVSCFVAILAIWGNSIRAWWVGAKLKLELISSEGERIDIAIDNRSLPSRFYHLRVSNSRRSSPATNTRVFLTKLSRPRADGEFVSNELTGPIPLSWQHSHSFPMELTFGPEHNADLGFVTKNGPLLCL
ncbi:MAG: hypothetical protein QM808_14145 [Steroidobacteraceae bacterium]